MRPNKDILVVEDDPIIRQVISDYLSAQGFTIRVATDGSDGLKQFRESTPDLMIIDALLPLKSGFEVCFEVRRTAEGRSLPVLLMSAVCNDAHSAHHATLDLKAQGYLIKPFKMRDLLKSVDIADWWHELANRSRVPNEVSPVHRGDGHGAAAARPAHGHLVGIHARRRIRAAHARCTARRALFRGTGTSTRSSARRHSRTLSRGSAGARSALRSRWAGSTSRWT